MTLDDSYPSYTEFLRAQTRSDSGDWDSYVLRSSGNLELPAVDSTSGTLSPEASAQIGRVSARLVETFKNYKTYMKFLDHREGSAQDLLDLLQKLLDHAPMKPQFHVLFCVALVRLCRKSELCPRSFYLQGVSGQGRYPHSAGKFGDVYKAYYKNKPVSLKVVKLFEGSDKSKMHKAFSREAVVWAQLSHPNILPFCGIHYSEDSQISLVSPWISGGTVVEFLSRTRNANRRHLIQGIAAGMKYLHDNGVVHGDLKPTNVLVKEPEQALLVDFGYSYITDDDGLQDTSLSSSHLPGGTREFEAPERIEDPMGRKTKESDVFAFGMVCYQLFTLPPLENVKAPSISSVHYKIISGSPNFLGRFTSYSSRGLTQQMWEMMEACWSHKLDARPIAADIVRLFPSVERTYVSDGWSLPSRPGFNPSGGQDDTIKKALSHL